MGVSIQAIEYVFPDHKVSNDDLSAIFPDYDFAQFEAKVGIQNRYWVADGETALDLGRKASLKLLERVDKGSIDFLIYCTQSPEYLMPTTACILQDQLGLRKNVGALDINLGCSGFAYGLSLAKGLVNSGQAKNILLVTAETYSRYMHPGDRSNRAIFGDAATATLIAYTDEENFGSFMFGTDGSAYDKLIIKNGGARFPKDPNAEEIVYGTNNVYTENYFYMNGPDVFNFTTGVIPGFARELLAENGVEVQDVQQFIFHQANAFMLNIIRKSLKIAPEDFFIDLKDGGNTVSCTLPIALKKYSQQISAPEKIVLLGFGIGLSWAGGMVTINDKL